MTETLATGPAEATGPVAAPLIPPYSRASGFAAFRALLLRDLTVLDKDLREFLPNTLIQPILLVFTFTYVFPKIGQGIGAGGNGGEARFATLLLGGMVAQAIIFSGIFRVALPVAREFDITSEIEDRVLSPISIWAIGLERIVAGALQAFFAGLVVFPIAAFLPATPIYLKAHWLVLISVGLLVCLASSAIGLTVGTRIEPRLVPPLASFVALPLAFLGAIFYTWDSLTPVPWLKYLVLVNPLVYMSEGFRAAVAVGVPTMPLTAIYGALGGFTVLFTILGVTGFKKRVLS
jgi:ABC-2 type transport system permease protein